MTDEQKKEIMDLIPPQHKNKNFVEWVYAWTDKIIDSYIDFEPYFNIDTATGHQLDIIGESVGISRTLRFIPQSGDSSVLNDDLYRLVIYAQVAKNNWDGTMPNIQELWKILLPNRVLIVIDNLDMSIDVVVYNTESALERELIDKLYFVPKPSGVRTNYLFPSEKPAFGYDRDDQYVKGYDEGEWVKGIS